MTGDEELRAAGVDVDAMRADARAAVAEATPDGWEAVHVRSPWPAARCPHCGAVLDGGNAAVGVLTRRLHRARVLLFALAPVCGECVQRPNRLAALALKTFE